MSSVVDLKQKIQPVISLFGGAATIYAKHSQAYLGDEEDIFTYHTIGHGKTTGLMGVFLGGEYQLPHPGFFVQAGIEYASLGHININGLSAVGVEPATSTHHIYHYRFQTQQALFMSKILATIHQIYHPYVSMGLGAAFNHSSQFNNETQETGSINLTPTFQNKKQTALSYSLGLGVDTNLNQHVRIGFGYRFAGIGKSSLGNGQVTINDYRAPTSFTLRTPNAYMNQLIAQISYLA